MMDKIAIMNQARKKYAVEHEDSIRNQALALFNSYKNEPLFVAGIMLYWAEGRNNISQRWILELTNSNPKLLKVYCDFIRRYFNPDLKDLKARVFLYPDLDDLETKAFWSQALSIPQDQFIKSQIITSRSNVTKNKLAYGICSVYIYSKDKRIMMDTWIESFGNMRR